MKSAQVYNYISNANEYGIETEGVAKPNLTKIVERSRAIAERMSNGVQYLFKKNKIELINGFGKLISNSIVEVTDETGNKKNISAKNIILATGARSRNLPNIPQDGTKIIGYRKALTLTQIP